MGLLNRIKKWFSGGSKKSSSSSFDDSKRKRTVTSVGGGGGGAYTYQSYRNAYEETRNRQQSNNEKTFGKIGENINRKTYASASGSSKGVGNVAKTVSSTASDTAKSVSANAPKRTTYQSATNSKAMDRLKERMETSEKNDQKIQRAKNRESLAERSKKESDRYERYMGDDKRSRREALLEQKIGASDRTAKEAMYEAAFHPNQLAFSRGLARGVTLGASDLLEKQQGGQFKAATDLYKRNQTGTQKALEFGGEMAGNLATFGVTGGITRGLGERGITGAAKLTKSGRAALAAVDKADDAARVARRIGEASPEIKAIANTIAKGDAKKAARIAKFLDGVATDAGINLTTGNLQAAISASQVEGSTEDKVKDYLKNQGINVALGAGLEAGALGVNALRNRGAREAVEDVVADTLARDVVENADEAVAARPQIENADLIREPQTQQIDEAAQTAENADLIREPARPQAENADLIRNPEQPVAEQPRAEAAAEQPVSTNEAQATAGASETSVAETPNEETGTVETPDAEASQYAQTDEEIPIGTAQERAKTEAAKNDKSEPPFVKRGNSNADAYTEEAKRFGFADAKELAEYAKRIHDINDRLPTGHEVSQAVDTLYKHTVDKMDREALKEAIEREAKELIGGEKEFGNFVKDVKHVNTEYEKAIRNAEDNPLATLKRLSEAFNDPTYTPTTEDMFDAIAMRQITENIDGLDLKTAKEICNGVSVNSVSKSAQTLVMWRYLQKMTPEGRAITINRDINNYLERLGRFNDRDGIMKRFEDVFGESFDDYVKRASEATSEKDFERLRNELTVKILQCTPRRFTDIWNTYRHLNMLSRPTTWLNNFFGNTGGVLNSSMDSANQAMLERFFGEKVAKSAKVLNLEDRMRIRSKDMDDKLVKIINESAEADMPKMMRSNKMGIETNLGRLVTYDSSTRNALHKVGNAIQIGGEAVGNVLNEGLPLARFLGDRSFVEYHYKKYMLEYLRANGYGTDAVKEVADDKLVERARAYAMRKAEEFTYKDQNEVAKVLDGIAQRGYRPDATLGQRAAAFALDAALPYRKVPTNVLRQNLRHSPLGLATGSVNAYKALKRGDAELLNRACEQLAQGMTGAEIMGLGMFLACRDIEGDNSMGLIAELPDDDAGKYMKSKGYREYSLKIGKYNLDMSNLAPAAAEFFSGVQTRNWLNSVAEGDLSLGDCMELAQAYVAPTFEMSMLDNAYQLFQAGKYADSAAGTFGAVGYQLAANYAGQAIAQPIKAIGRGMASSDLNTEATGKSSTSKAVNRQKNLLLSGIPLLNQKALAPKVDAFGHVVNERDSAGEKFLASAKNLVDPLKIQKAELSDDERTLINLSRETGESSVLPQVRDDWDVKVGASGQKGYESTKETFDLTNKERAQVQIAQGESGEDIAKRLVKRGYWGKATEEKALRFIANIPSDTEDALNYVLNSDVYKDADKDTKAKIMSDFWQGRERTAQHEAYVNINGKTEDEFRFKVDLNAREQSLYDDSWGISKGDYVDILENCKKCYWKEGESNKYYFRANEAKQYLASRTDLTAEQKAALYNAVKPSNYKEWDGSTISSGRSGYGRRSYGYRRSGGGSKSTKKIKSPLKTSGYKASTKKYASAAKSGSSSSSKSKVVKTKSEITDKILPPTPIR